MRHEEVRGQDFLNHGAHPGQRELRLPAPPTFVLQKAVRDGGQHNVALPARQAAAFDVVEPDLVFQFLILLLDRPPLVRELHESAQGRGHREIHQVVLDPRRRTEIALAQQPHFGRESVLAPVVGRRTRTVTRSP